MAWGFPDRWMPDPAGVRVWERDQEREARVERWPSDLHPTVTIGGRDWPVRLGRLGRTRARKEWAEPHSAQGVLTNLN